MLCKALEVIAAWDFSYKACLVWDKISHNFGHYASLRHELLLIGTRGSCLPESDKLIDSVQSIKRTKHSSKPQQFRKIIDALYPSRERLELFARGDVPPHWQKWGAEAQ